MTLGPDGGNLHMHTGRAVTVCRLDALPEEGLLAVAAEGREIVLARVDGRVFAMDNLCSHASGWLDMGRLHAESLEVECPLHDGRFSLRDGSPTRPPCVEPQATYEVLVDGDDVLVVLPADG